MAQKIHYSLLTSRTRPTLAVLSCRQADKWNASFLSELFDIASLKISISILIPYSLGLQGRGKKSPVLDESTAVTLCFCLGSCQSPVTGLGVLRQPVTWIQTSETDWATFKLTSSSYLQLPLLCLYSGPLEGFWGWHEIRHEGLPPRKPALHRHDPTCLPMKLRGLVQWAF